ncbi:MAG TPA: adenylate/guanylate cyclase domain-containing protein [Vicinamibacterales bacterium]|nr:adenylate/guanylate cyclase domain-containing protein [Vicinamibacterales bacterium]
MFVLIVTQRGARQEFLLGEGRTILGRGQNCDVVINDESISRQHARLVVGPDQVELSDLQSRNGTYVAGRPVRDATLRGGEQLSFGDVTATIEQRAQAPAAGPTVHAIGGEHTMFRTLGDTSPPNSAVRIVEAPRLINLLSEVARTLVATVPVQDILNRVIDLLLAHVPAERACLALAQPGTQALTSQIVRRSDGKPAQPVQISRTVRDMTLSQRIAVLTSDAHQDPRFDTSQSVLLGDVRSLICGPLYAGEELVGLLYVDNPVTRQFTEADLELFSAIANYAAVAIAQGRLAARLRDESERRERLQRYHSPAVVERIMAHGHGEGADVLAAQDRDISVLFADLVGFTTLCETLAPTEVAALLNRFFSEMTEAIFAEEGTVDKFIGDAILAVFGAPVEQADHAQRAVRAAQAMRRSVAKLNAAGGRPLHVRYAINSGVAIAGDVGSARRREYTVLGDVVNTAARLERLAQPDQIIVSRATYDRIAPPIAATPLGEVTLRGRTARVEILSIDPA